ncbi:SRPBCC family protein [Terrabacter sp. NPDC080008]|uniref:SRPBCC family protein n=1 Tax=Terrabacter sp. NPDC080008 TaxID=3155176 RepID=UPI00344FC79F
MEIERTVTVDQPVDRVFAYLSDFTTTTEWDPGTVRTDRVSGEGGVGTHYRNVSKFLGRETELDYLVVEHEPDHRFALRGENATVVAHDTMTIVPAATRSGTTAGEGTTVTYRAEFEFKGLARYVAPLLSPALKKLGDDAERGLREALGKLE